MQYFKYALCAMAAGALIPVMAVLNAKLGRTLGAPLQAVAAQIITSAVIDHFGWLGAPVRPVGWLRLLGIALLLAGLAIAQMAAQKTPPVS